MKLRVVEVIQGFQAPEYFVSPGARVMAWQRATGEWVVYFNGNDVPVPDGTVRDLNSAPSESKAAPIYSAARLEQYQVAPAKPE